MKVFFLITGILFSSVLCSQIKDSVVCNKEDIKYPADTVYAHIKGIELIKEGVFEVSAGYFNNQTQLLLSDSSYKVARFSITWSDENNIYERPNKGSIINPDFIDKDNLLKEEYSFKKLRPGFYMAIDRIIIEKEGKCFLAKPILLSLR